MPRSRTSGPSHPGTPRSLALTLAFAVTVGGTAMADTVTVTQLDDVADFGGPRQIANLPGPDGLVSFREAVIAVNNTPGEHDIQFAVPVDPGDPLGTLLRIDGPAFVVTRDHTRIDFLSQLIFLGDPDPQGPGLGILNVHPGFLGQPAIVINASACEIRGLGRSQFRDSIEVVGGHDNRFVRNFTDVIRLAPSFGTTTTGNVIGGTGPDDGNEVDVVSIACGADENVVIGNRIRQIDVTGSPFCGEGTRRPTGNRIGGPTAAERNVVSGFGTYSGEGRPSGTGILVDYALGTIVEGNYVGVTDDGMAQAADQHRGTTGIGVRDSIDTTVRGNLVAGIRGIGIAGFAGQVFGRAIHVSGLNDDVTGVVIEGNLIGTDATGETAILTRAGIEVIPGTASRQIEDVRIGGAEPGAANVIAFTELGGITIEGQNVSGVEVSRNRIHDNEGLGINLGPGSGVTPNDPGDFDGGPNHGQNFPTLATATLEGAAVTVTGTLASQPARSYRVEFFASPAADSSGHGEGRFHLGDVLLDTDATGEGTFAASLTGVPAGISTDWIVSATATDILRRETSEFSAVIEVVAGPSCVADLDGSSAVDLADLLLLLGAWGVEGDPADLDGDGMVGASDLLTLLASWGPCG